MKNVFGEKFTVEVYGASHAPSIGAIITGCPIGLALASQDFEKDMARRRPGQALATQRSEADVVEILSGVAGGVTTGQPIKLQIANKDTRSEDYEELKRKIRPGHADYAARLKFGSAFDLRGGGIFSGRMTAPLVAAGVIAKKILAGKGTSISARLVQVGKETDPNKFEQEIIKAKSEGDSIGGKAECIVENPEVGLGEPFFDSVESVMSHAMFSVPAVKGIEFGSGFNCIEMKGSEHNDEFVAVGGKIATKTNNAGGILGGIANGMPIVFRVAFKPTSSIAKKQNTIDMATMQPTTLEVKGRHDPCLALRTPSVVEAVAAIVLADFTLILEEEKTRKQALIGEVK